MAEKTLLDLMSLGLGQAVAYRERRQEYSSQRL